VAGLVVAIALLKKKEGGFGGVGNITRFTRRGSRD
jgi:hypothetical protein